MKRMFMYCLIFVFSISLALSAFESGEGAEIVSRISFFPGLRAFALSGNYPFAAYVSILFSIIASIFFVICSWRKKIDMVSARKVVGELSMTQRILYATFGLLLIVFPLFGSPVADDSHQVSSGFFHLVGSRPLVLAIFTAGVFSYTSAILVFVRIISKKGD